MKPWHHTPIPLHPDDALKEAWIGRLGSAEAKRLQRRLKWEQIKPSHLGAADTDWQSGLAQLQHALHECAKAPLALQPASDQDPLFIELWSPVAEHVLRPLRQQAEHGVPWVGPEAWQAMAQTLTERLGQVAGPVLWSDFKTRRGLAALLLAHLDVDQGKVVPRAHYLAHIEHHRADALNDVLQRHPVLQRLLGTVVTQLLAAAAELIERLHADRGKLNQAFGIDPEATVQTLQWGLSDPHRGGRSVAIVVFTKATPPDSQSWRVVYKPKDLRIEQAYQTLVADLNEAGDLPPLKTLTVLTRPDYGYVEHVAHLPCDRPELSAAARQASLSQFYFNSGRLMALLHVLNGTDCHYENLIAHGEQLLLIDTETLFNSVIDAVNTAPSDQQDLQTQMAYSVLHQGLLPRWMFIGANKTAIDISALGVSASDLQQRLTDGWLHRNTDAMMPARVPQSADWPSSLPFGPGGENRVHEFVDQLEAGFRAQCQQLIERREHWLNTPHLWAAFHGVPRRVVIRNTYVYGHIQKQQLQPEALQSEQAQGLVLEQLARGYVLSDQHPQTWPLFIAELRQMEVLDIPYFEMAIDRTDMHVQGVAASIDLIPQDSLRTSQKQWLGLNQATTDFQARLLRGALMAKQVRDQSTACCDTEPPMSTVPAPLSPAQRHTLAQGLLGALATVAIRDAGNLPEWLGIDLAKDGQLFQFGPVGYSLYGGSLGVALLQAVLNDHVEVSPAQVLARLTQRLINSDPSEAQRWWRDEPLGLSGGGGLISSLLALADLSVAPAGPQHDVQDLMATLLSGLTVARIEADQALDIIGGVAGLIGPLLRLNTPHSVTLAVAAGDHLVAQQRSDGAWPIALGADRQAALTGFSHGASGMMAALACLYRATADPRYLQAVQRGWQWEQQWFDDHAGNWLDLRDHTAESPSRRCQISWCHGAPGIGLARLTLLGLGLDDQNLHTDIERAMQTTAAHRSAVDHLCCGNSGCATVLRIAAETLDRQDWARAADDIEAEMVASAQRLGPASAPQFRVFGHSDGELILPGLMTGLSGVGLSLLSRSDGQRLLARLLSLDTLPIDN